MIAAALFTVRTLEASASTNFPGVLSSTNTEYLNFVNQGTLASVNVTAGETVVAGQILAVQDNAAQAAAVVKDNVLLASDEQALGALLGPSGKLASQAAAKLLNKAYASSTADQQRGAASVSEAEAEVNAASAALTIAQGGLVTDRSAYKSGCPAGVGAGCQALAHNIVHDQTVITQDQTHVSNAQQILAHAQGLDGTLTNLAQQVLQDANQANPSVLPTVIQAIRQAREAVANDLYQQQVDQANLAATELPAPFAGKVIGVYAAADEIVGSAGTRLGSSSQASSVPSQGPSAGTSLSPSSPSNSSAASEPFISLNATGMQAVAQVPEAQISAIRLGEKATVTVNALSGNAAILHGRVSSINLQPVEVAGAVYYNVTVVPSTSWPSKVFAGMTANVAIP
jgi:multidrug efflux pump subunit AcrA (membrane-fusion protein)